MNINLDSSSSYGHLSVESSRCKRIQSSTQYMERPRHWNLETWNSISSGAPAFFLTNICKVALQEVSWEDKDHHMYGDYTMFWSRTIRRKVWVVASHRQNVLVENCGPNLQPEHHQRTQPAHENDADENEVVKT